MKKQIKTYVDVVERVLLRAGSALKEKFYLLPLTK